MPLDLKSAFIGMANPDIAIDNYFRDKNLRKRLTTAAEVDEAARATRAKAIRAEDDLEESKKEYSDTMRTAAAVGPQEIAPGIVRPSFTNAAMLRAEAGTAGISEAANRNTTARAVAPWTREMGETTGENVVATNRESTAKAMLARDDAEYALGLRPERLAKIQSGLRKDIKQNEAGITAAENQQQRDAAEMRAGLPKKFAETTAGNLDFNLANTSALMRENAATAAAKAKVAADKFKAQTAEQATATSKLTPEELESFRTLDTRARAKALKGAIAQADSSSALAALKGKAIEGFIDPATGEIDFKALKAATTLDQGKIIELMLGYLRGGNAMQNMMGGLQGNLFEANTTATRDPFDELD